MNPRVDSCTDEREEGFMLTKTAIGGLVLALTGFVLAGCQTVRMPNLPGHENVRLGVGGTTTGKRHVPYPPSGGGVVVRTKVGF